MSKTSDAERAMRARVAGRQRVEAATAWTLTIGAIVCRAVRQGHTYVLEIRDEHGRWTTTNTESPFAAVLLQAAASAPSVAKAIALQETAIARKNA